MLLRLGIDGYVDKVIVNPSKTADMTELLRQAPSPSPSRSTDSTGRG